MRKTVVGLELLLVGVIAAQFFFAAVGAMSSAPREETYQPHHALGPVIFLIPIVIAVLAVIARMSRRLIVLLLAVSTLTAVQVLLTKVAQALPDDGLSDAGPLLFGLHALNGLAILAIAAVVVRETWPKKATRALHRSESC